MPLLPFEVLSLVANLVMFVFVGFYLFSLRAREKSLEKRESQIDTEYHQVVDNALAKERKIMEEASFEANQIITGAQYVNRTSKETVDQALQKMIVDIHTEAFNAAKDFMASYQ